jgi:hypothetical protein
MKSRVIAQSSAKYRCLGEFFPCSCYRFMVFVAASDVF